MSASTEWDTQEKDDIYFLCSDGLSDLVSDEQITEILKGQSDIEVIADGLIEAALESGGKDNVSTIVCKI